MDMSLNVYYGKAEEVSVDERSKRCELYLQEDGCEISIIFDTVEEIKDFAIFMLQRAVQIEVEADRRRRELNAVSRVG